MAYIGNPAAPTLAQVSDNTITSAKIVDGAIATGDIADDAVTAAKISNTEDFVVNGLTVGKGAGNVATNTAVGASALAANTSGSGNTAIGSNAGQSITTGIANTLLGHIAGAAVSTGQITAVGYAALTSNTTASANTAVGVAALRYNTTGASNTALGDSALVSNTTGGNNVAIGQASLASNTTASNNTAVGYQAGYSTTADENAFFGAFAGYSNTTLRFGTMLGAYAGYNSTGEANTIIGAGAGSAITTGAKNTLIGRYNGNQGGLDIRTASNNIVLSDGDGNPRLRVDSASNIQLPDGTNFNTYFFNDGGYGKSLVMGNTYGGGKGYIAFHYNGSGIGQIYAASTSSVAYATSSDYRLKENISDMTGALDRLNQLKPKRYSWISENKAEADTDGLIAHEVQDIVPQAIGGNKDEVDAEGNPKYQSIDHSQLVPLLVGAVKELSAQVTALQAEVNTLKGA